MKYICHAERSGIVRRTIPRSRSTPTRGYHCKPGWNFYQSAGMATPTASQAGTETRFKVLATRYFFPRTFVPIRNNFLTVPVGRLFI
jgi:hypothetical protein